VHVFVQLRVLDGSEGDKRVHGVVSDGSPSPDHDRSRMRAMRHTRLGKPFPQLLRISFALVGLSMGLLSGLLDGWLHGWGLPILVAATAVVIPATYYRSQWRHAWFWMVIAPLVVLQAPMLIVSKPLMDQLKFVSLVGFAILDASLVVVAVNWMSPKSHEND
jgi:hypothetical protein